MNVSSWLLKQEYPVISSYVCGMSLNEADNHFEELSAVQPTGGEWFRNISEIVSELAQRYNETLQERSLRKDILEIEDQL